MGVGELTCFQVCVQRLRAVVVGQNVTLGTVFGRCNSGITLTCVSHERTQLFLVDHKSSSEPFIIRLAAWEYVPIIPQSCRPDSVK